MGKSHVRRNVEFHADAFRMRETLGCRPLSFGINIAIRQLGLRRARGGCAVRCAPVSRGARA
eukprot:8428733-Pyramimonas_sp.AAC.1